MTAQGLGFVDPRVLLAKHGVSPKKSWGQSFLVSESAVRKIAAIAVDEPGRCVIEIGAGLGTLTALLLDAGARVIAVEREREMCSVLRAELGGNPSFDLAEADAATFDYDAALGAGGGVVVGNLPYQITGRLLKRVTRIGPSLMRAVLMIQEEVADRVAAGPGERDRGALSVGIQARCHVEIVRRLPPTAFYPRPRVRSAVLSLTPRSDWCFADAGAEERFDRLVGAAFTARRKTLRNSLAAGGVGPMERVERHLDRAGIDPATRAERLSVADFVALAPLLAE